MSEYMENLAAQTAASKYLLSICDVCAHCKETLTKDGILIQARCKREDVTGGSDRARNRCTNFRPDMQKIDEVIELATLLHEQTCAALHALK